MMSFITSTSTEDYRLVEKRGRVEKEKTLGGNSLIISLSSSLTVCNAR